jgi:hypothetical protein
LFKKFIFFALVAFSSASFALSVETRDEQAASANMEVLRLRVVNDGPLDLRNVKIKYYIRNGLAVDVYDSAGNAVSVDTVGSETLALTVSVDVLPVGVFPYEAGMCFGIHGGDWLPYDKSGNYSYTGNVVFGLNANVTVYVGDSLAYGTPFGGAFPKTSEANPLTLVPDTKILINPGDSVSFAWHYVPDAEKYRLTILSLDSEKVYQEELYGLRKAVQLSPGNYLWNVQAGSSEALSQKNNNVINYNPLTVADFHSLHITKQKYLGVPSVSGRKDTPMLVVGYGEYADLREWDRPHLNHPGLDELESHVCWAIALKNLNAFYGGTLSLDEIIFRKKGPGIDVFRFLINAESGISEYDIQQVLDSTKSYSMGSKLKNPLISENAKNYIDGNNILLIQMNWESGEGHYMLIDGYVESEEETFFRYVNTDNYGSYGLFDESFLQTIGSYFVIEPLDNVRNMDSTLGVVKYDMYNTWTEWKDSDGDGLTDFDEIKRFHTCSGLPAYDPDYCVGVDPQDSDGDGVDDKDEIYSYTILEKSRLNLNSAYPGPFDLNQMQVIAGIESEYMADVDGDGLRAELDKDSDGDSLLDGVDPNPYNYDFLGAVSLEENELPEDVVLYARERLRVNDGCTCIGQYSVPCVYASEDTVFNYGVTLGVNTSGALVHSKNNVFIQSNRANTFFVNFYGDEKLRVDRQDEKATIVQYKDPKHWPWKLNINLPVFDEGDSVLVVQRGDTCYLDDGAHLKELKVESGGVVYFPAGNVYIGYLQLDAGSLIFPKPLYESNLYVKRNMIWNSSFPVSRTSVHQDLAENFRLFYYGDRRIFINADWFGTIIAPDAAVVLGQTQKKSMYGQVYAKEIVVHQVTDLHNVPFNPTYSNEKTEYVLDSEIFLRSKEGCL